MAEAETWRGAWSSGPEESAALEACNIGELLSFISRGERRLVTASTTRETKLSMISADKVGGC